MSRHTLCNLCDVFRHSPVVFFGRCPPIGTSDSKLLPWSNIWMGRPPSSYFRHRKSLPCDGCVLFWGYCMHSLRMCSRCVDRRCPTMGRTHICSYDVFCWSIWVVTSVTPADWLFLFSDKTHERTLMRLDGNQPALHFLANRPLSESEAVLCVGDVDLRRWWGLNGLLLLPIWAAWSSFLIIIDCRIFVLLGVSWAFASMKASEIDHLPKVSVRIACSVPAAIRYASTNLINW